MEQHERLALRKFQNEDKALFQRWLCEDHVARWHEHPLDRMAEIEQRDGEHSWIRRFIAELDGAPLGFGQSHEYCRDGETRHGAVDTVGACSIDYLVGEPGCVGRGLSKKLILALSDEVALQGDARRIIVRPAPENAASRRALLPAGFAFDEDNELYRRELQHRPDKAPSAKEAREHEDLQRAAEG